MLTLRLPDVEKIRVDKRVAELETERSEFGQRGVADNNWRLLFAELVQSHVSRVVFLIVENGVALGESTALDILSGKADVIAFERERAESERLSGGPVDTCTFLNGLFALADDSSQILVRFEVVGEATDDGTDALEHGLIDTSRLALQNIGLQLLRRWEAIPRRGKPFPRGSLVLLAGFESLLEHTPNPLLVLVNFLFVECTLIDQALSVQLQGGCLLCHGGIHLRLSEHGLICLVVAVLSVADNIDDNVLAELGSPVGGKLRDKVDSLGIVAIHVEDRSIDSFCDIGGVGGRSPLTRIGSEPDLVVDDHVNSSASGIIGQVSEAHRLVDNTLAGKGCVSMQKNSHRRLDIVVAIEELQSSSLAEDNGVFRLEMRRVGDERKSNALAGWRRADVVSTQMVLYVTAAFFIRVCRSSKFGQDGFDGFPDNVGKDIQSTTMGHADHDRLDARVDRSVDESLHAGNQRFSTLEAETLFVGILRGDEALEGVGPDHSIKNHAFLVDRVFEGLGHLKSRSKPVALLAVRNVEILSTNVTA